VLVLVACPWASVAWPGAAPVVPTGSAVAVSVDPAGLVGVATGTIVFLGADVGTGVFAGADVGMGVFVGGVVMGGGGVLVAGTGVSVDGALPPAPLQAGLLASATSNVGAPPAVGTA